MFQKLKNLFNRPRVKVVELPNGKFVALVRGKVGYYALDASGDGGTWRTTKCIRNWCQCNTEARCHELAMRHVNERDIERAIRKAM